MKKIKSLVLVIAFALSVFAFCGANINAAEVNSIEELKTLFDGQKVTIDGTTVILNDNVTIDDVVDICDGEYTLNLNGYTLKMTEFYINKGKLTIDDATKKGKIDALFVSIEQEGTLIVNQCIFETDTVEEYDGELYEIYTDISNLGNLTIKNGSVQNTIWNDEGGKLIIENATARNISQFGTATIKNGTFDTLNTDISIAKTEILGGEFKGYVDDGFAVMLQSKEEIDKETINTLLPEGYVAVFDDFTLETNTMEDGSNYYTGLYGLNVKIAKDTDTYSDVFKKITEDGIWEITSFIPENAENAEFLFTSIISDIIEPLGYSGYGVPAGEVFNPEKATIYIYNEDGELYEKHNVKLKYTLPSEEVKSKIDSVTDKMKDYKTFEDMNEKTGYRLEDLYLINYLNSNNDGLDGKALNFSKELIEATNGSNISFKFDGRAGGADEAGLYSFAMGQAIVYYDGVAFTTKNAAVTASHVLYIPSSTENTADAYIKAAKKRITDYLGKDIKFDIKLGGTLESLNYYDQYAGKVITFNEYGLIDETTCGSNYYDVTINDETYRFAICKKDDQKLETPKYLGSDINSKISITSDNTKIPLDTALTVKNIVSEKIEKTLGTDKYSAFDISLYSNAKEEKISKLDEGTFTVNIPIPQDFIGKDIIVCYVDAENNKKEEYQVSINDNMLSFETNHFSTYVVTEKVSDTPANDDKGEKDDTPNTGVEDKLSYILAITVISGLGALTLKREMK